MKKNKETQPKIIGTFEDIIKASVAGNPAPKPKVKKKTKSNKKK